MFKGRSNKSKRVEVKKMFTIRRIVLVVFVMGVFFSGVSIANEATTYTIGVLAKRGTETCLAKWTATADYLSETIDNAGFEIVPLDFNQVNPAVEAGEVDFIITNPSFYVGLELLHGASRIATLKNMVSNGKSSTVFGGVIFCRADRQDIHQIADLKNKTFMAVKDTSFGGWQTAWRQIKGLGMDPQTDFADLQFGGSHDAVVHAVVDGRVDAGTVRTDTLERMAEEGRVNLNDFRIVSSHGENKHYTVDPKHTEEGLAVDFPLAHSTRLYPEWPFAKLLETDDTIAAKVSSALLSMSAENAAAKAARCAGWTIPYNYSPVHNCLKELRIGPYKDHGKISTADLVERYWPGLLVAAGAILTVVSVACHTRRLNKELGETIAHRKQAEQTLLECDQQFMNTFHHSADATLLIDGETFTDCNERTVEMLKAPSRDDVLSTHPSQLSPETQPDGRSSFEKAGEMIATAHEKGSNRFEWAHRRLNGEVFPVEVTLMPVSLFGKQQLYCMWKDITEQKENEKKLTDAQEQMQRMNHLMTGREDRVVAMKKEINALLVEFGREPQYQSVLKGKRIDLWSGISEKER